MLDTFTATLNGMVPLSGGGIAKHLRADGSWSAISLGEALAGSNTSSGANIVLSTGDELVSPTDLVMRTIGAGSNIEMNPNASGSVKVNGELEVTGYVDSSGAIFSESPIVATLANQGAISLSDGSFGIKNRPYYRGEVGAIPSELLNAPNEVLITKLADFPTPVLGVITLDGTKIYRISGIVDITPNKITSSGPLLIHGTIITLDRIITNHPTALIDHKNGFPLQIREMYLQNSGGKVFDVDGLSSATSNISIDRVAIVGSPAAGIFKDTFRFDTSQSAMLNCADGITFDGNHPVIGIFDLGIPATVGGAFTGLTTTATATIGAIRISDSNIFLSGAGDVGFNLNLGTTFSNPPARFDDIVFGGLGTPLVGRQKTDPNTEYFQCIGVLNSIHLGSVGFSFPTPKIIPTAAAGLGVFIDIETAPATLIYSENPLTERFSLSNGNNGIITYDGVKDITANIEVSISAAGSGGSVRPIAIALFVDRGAGFILCPDSTFYGSAASTPSFNKAVCVTSLSPGDALVARVAQIAGGGVNLEINTVRINITAESL